MNRRWIESIDEIDNKILDIISENARLTYKEIGELTGISRVSVKTRMDAMQEKGIIKGFKTVIDPMGMPEGTRFFLDIECSPEYYEDVILHLAENNMVRQVYSVSGECRIHAVGFASNTRNLEYFANSIFRNLNGIRKLACHTVLSTMLDVDGGIDYVRSQKNEHMEA